MLLYNGTIHYFDWAIFNSFLYVYQAGSKSLSPPYGSSMKQSDVDPLDPLLLFLWGFLPRPQLADVDLANVAWSFVTAGLSGSVPPNFPAAEDFWFNQVTFEEDPIARNRTK